MNGFERRKERKKESIRWAALELFKTYGFKKVSINDIARKAGVSQVTIYNHFGSKEELVRDVVKTLVLSLLDKYRAIIKGEKPFLEKLETIVFDKTQIASQYQGELMQSVIHNDPELQQFIESLWQREISRLVLDFFEEGKRQGYVNPELSQESILVYYEILRKGIFASSILIGSTEQSGKLVRDLMSLFVYGLVGKSESASRLPRTQERR